MVPRAKMAQYTVNCTWNDSKTILLTCFSCFSDELAAFFVVISVLIGLAGAFSMVFFTGTSLLDADFDDVTGSASLLADATLFPPAFDGVCNKSCDANLFLVSRPSFKNSAATFTSAFFCASEKVAHSWSGLILSPPPVIFQAKSSRKNQFAVPLRTRQAP